MGDLITVYWMEIQTAAMLQRRSYMMSSSHEYLRYSENAIRYML